MQPRIQPRTGIAIVAVLTAALCQGAAGQDAQSKEAQSRETKGLPARAAPGDYQAHAQAGALTIAAEFSAHSISSPQGVLNTEDYVVVEVAFFGPPDTHINLSGDEFSLRINGKKPLPVQPYAMVFGSLKDPEWEAPEAADAKSKTSIGTGGGGQSDPSATPKIVHVPIAIERGWQQRVQKGALPEGDRTVPTAGLIFFKYHGKADGIDTIDLAYAGSAGKATLKLHP